MGKQRVDAGSKILMEHNVPNYSYPEEAVSSLNAMYRYGVWVNRPEKQYPTFPGLRDKALHIFEKARQENRDRLTDAEVPDVLSAYGFARPKNMVARTSAEAVDAAREIGYPVVMKIVSPQVVHKSDIGGVRTNLENRHDVENAFFDITTRVRNIMPAAQIYGVMIQEMVQGGKEIIMGITKDPQFGHMIMFGLGGIYVEVLKDIAFRVTPLSREDAHEMIRETKTFPLLRGVRGETESDIEAIEHSLLILSQMAADFPQIIEADINPLLVRKRGEGVVAIDARFAIGGE
jgi:acetyltransferase